jgi:hypothetical protein
MNDARLWNEALWDAAREMTGAESPAELARRGVRRVRSVSREQLSALLDKAVEKALRKRGLGDEDVSDLVDNMQAGWLDLLRGVKQVEVARSALADQRRELEGEVGSLTLARGTGVEPATSFVAMNDPSAVARALRERDSLIESLERRLAKVVKALEETERAFQQALASAHFDHGIASLYRVVQGLSADAPHVQQKRMLMEEIFRANLNLRAEFGNAE